MPIDASALGRAMPEVSDHIAMAPTTLSAGRSQVTPPLVRFEQVSLDYEGRNGTTRAIDNLSLDLPEGSFTCVVGRSGCGKTTLLHLLAGLIRPTRGVVRLRGAEVDGCDKDRGVVFQSANALLPWMNVEDNVAIGLRMAGMPATERRVVVGELLELLGLSEFNKHRTYELSGGMQQRVAIGRVLAMKPAILLMDEPFGALDALTRTMLQNTLREIWQEKRFTALFITHNVEEALLLGTNVVVMAGHPGGIKSQIHVPDEVHDGSAEQTLKLSEMEDEVLSLVMSA
jgi:ABC-type nitrate/sulfonate/bicarbonate transport system ATPase subunit